MLRLNDKVIWCAGCQTYHLISNCKEVGEKNKFKIDMSGMLIATLYKCPQGKLII